MSVDISYNKISVLPRSANMPNLVTFLARDNRLHELPSSFVACRSLECLNLDGNPLQTSVWEVVAKLPNLLEFSHIASPETLWLL